MSKKEHYQVLCINMDTDTNECLDGVDGAKCVGFLGEKCEGYENYFDAHNVLALYKNKEGGNQK